MGLVEKLNQSELNMMQKYIDYYAANDANCRYRMPVAEILKVWDESKSQYLYKMLGEKFDIVKEFKAIKDGEMLEDEIRKALTDYCSAGHEFVQNLHDYCYRHRYTESGGWDDDVLAMEDLLRTDDLASNLYSGRSFTVKFPNGDSLKVNHGCKVSKVLGKIAAGLNIEGYEAFRIAHSQVLNEKSFVGNMHLTIHPMDFMTMSDNECGWSSCMSWMEEGEYRRGTVEMMNSVSVVEAYIPASNDMTVYNNYTWNNKKWRQLFIVTPTFITAIKGYPYWNRDLEKIAMDWIKELAVGNLGYGPYLDKKFTFHGTDEFFVPELNKNVRFRFYTGAMYCDFCYDHSAYISPNILENVEFTYSGPSQCMACGHTEGWYNNEGSLCCEDCDDRYECYSCGDRHAREDMYYVDGEYYCDYCYNNLPSCSVCEEVHTNSCMYEINVGDASGISYIYANLCEDCYAKYHLEDKTKEYEKHWSTYRYIHINDMTEEIATRIFGYGSLEDLQEDLAGQRHRMVEFDKAS